MTNQEKIIKAFNEEYDIVDLPIIKGMLIDMLMRVPIHILEQKTDIVITDLKEQFIDVKLKLEEDFFLQSSEVKKSIVDALFLQKFNQQTFYIN